MASQSILIGTGCMQDVLTSECPVVRDDTTNDTVNLGVPLSVAVHGLKR